MDYNLFVVTGGKWVALRTFFKGKKKNDEFHNKFWVFLKRVMGNLFIVSIPMQCRKLYMSHLNLIFFSMLVMP